MDIIVNYYLRILFYMAIIAYSREMLLMLRKWTKTSFALYAAGPSLATCTWQELKSLGLLKISGGTRAGKYCKWKKEKHNKRMMQVNSGTCGDIFNIPVVVSQER